MESLGKILSQVSFRGKWRVVDALGNVCSRVTPEVDCFPAPGARVSVALSDRVQKLMWAGCYERELIAFLRSILSDGKVYLDVGAHIGYFAVFAGFLVGETGRVFAFEPDPRCFAGLTWNTRNYPWIRIFQTAIADSTGEATFFRSNVTTEWGWGSINKAEQARKSITVPVTSLDAWAGSQAEPKIDFLKMDVEGAEPRALLGARNLIERSRPVLFLEINEGCLARDGKSPDDVLRLLSSFGYSIMGLPNRKTRALEACVAVPRERADLLDRVKRSKVELVRLA